MGRGCAVMVNPLPSVGPASSPPAERTKSSPSTHLEPHGAWASSIPSEVHPFTSSPTTLLGSHSGSQGGSSQSGTVDFTASSSSGADIALLWAVGGTAWPTSLPNGLKVVNSFNTSNCCGSAGVAVGICWCRDLLGYWLSSRKTGTGLLAGVKRGVQANRWAPSITVGGGCTHDEALSY